MHHDFEDIKGSTTCKSTPMDPCCQGFMHYGRHENLWSDCSVTEFQMNYRKYEWATSCLKGKFRNSNGVTRLFSFKNLRIPLGTKHFLSNIFFVLELKEDDKNKTHGVNTNKGNIFSQFKIM
jgi:hypothetical protein